MLWLCIFIILESAHLHISQIAIEPVTVFIILKHRNLSKSDYLSEIIKALIILLMSFAEI